MRFYKRDLETSSGHVDKVRRYSMGICFVFGLGLIHQSSPFSALSDTAAIEEMATRDSELRPAPVAKNRSDNQLLNDQNLEELIAPLTLIYNIKVSR